VFELSADCEHGKMLRARLSHSTFLPLIDSCEVDEAVRECMKDTLLVCQASNCRSSVTQDTLPVLSVLVLFGRRRTRSVIYGSKI